MYTPHMIALVNAVENAQMGMDNYVTILGEVFVDTTKRHNALTGGLTDGDTATLFIPFSTIGKGTDGSRKEYISPKAFEALEDKTGYWTVKEGGASGSAECYFVKIDDNSDLTDITPFSTAKKKLDNVYVVTSVSMRDFGSTDMRHIQVGAR